MDAGLNTSKTPRISRRALLAAVVAIAIIALAGSVSYALIETDEQAAVRNYNTARAEAIEYLGSPTDWYAWYSARIQGRDGSLEYLSWCRAADELEDLLHNDDEERGTIGQNPILDAVARELVGEEPYSDIPTKGQVAEYLTATDEIYRASLELQRFDTITGIPDLSDGTPGWHVIRTLNASKTLVARVYAHAWQGDMQTAWVECLNLLKHISRMKHPTSLVEQLISAGIEGLTQDAFVALCGLETPPPDFDAFYPMSMPASQLTELLEGELAYVAQSPEASTEIFERETSKRSLKRRWKDLFKDEVSDSEEQVEYLNQGAEYVRQMIRELDARRAGTTTTTTDSMFGLVWSRSDAGRARTVCDRMRANLAFQLRRAESAGSPLLKFRADPASYTEVQYTTDADGTATVTWKASPKVIDSLLSPVSTEEDLELEFSPIRLKPLK